MRRKYLLIVVSVLMATAAAAWVVYAGNPGTPPGPPETTSSYTLEAIYNRLVTGEAGTQITFTEPISGPMVGTGHTLDEIMGVAPSVDDTNGATQAQVLTGKTAWGLTSAGWGLMTGTMAAASGNAAAADVLTGKTFSNDSGAGLSGTMADNGAVTLMPTTTNQTIAKGYHNGSGYVVGDVDLAASKIVSDTVIFGVAGTYPWGAVPKTGAGNLAGYTEEVGEDGHVNMRRGVAWPSPRFTDNNDGTVTDNLTGLIWLKSANCPNAPRNWSTALSDVTQLNTDGTMNSNDCIDTSNGGSHQTDWRLPNVRELFSLIDLSDYNPALPSSPFTGVQLAFYWSNTTRASDTSDAWFVSLGNGIVALDEKTFSYYVWPVRGGQ